MRHRVDAVERAVEGVPVAQVGPDGAHTARCGPGVVVVHVGPQGVEGHHVVTALDELSHHLRTDEPGSAGDEDAHRATVPAGTP